MKVFLDSIGCRLNQSEIEAMAAQFRAAGHVVVDSPQGADLVVVNTCAVTSEAASDSRQKIRQAARAGAGEIVATGCWTTLEPQAALRLPGVARAVSNMEKDELVSQVLGLPQADFDLEPLAREPLPGLRQRTRAFIKVQDGCDNHCTFCITRVARGAGRSRTLAEVLGDVERAVQGGALEVVLTGVHLGSWGQDFQPRQHLADLVRGLLTHSSAARLRLSSLEPWDLDESFFQLWQDARLCRHLHLPLQAGSAAVLRRMARKTTPDQFRALVAQARAAVPEVAVTTDLLVGFPGEGEAEFAEGLAFVREMGFAGGHVFAFSPRPGTPAAGYADPVPSPVKKQRSALMRAAVAESAAAYAQSFVGRTVEVLWEVCSALGPEGWRMQGWTDQYVRVSAAAPQPLWNQISTVRLLRAQGETLEGEILAARQG